MPALFCGLGVENRMASCCWAVAFVLHFCFCFYICFFSFSFFLFLFFFFFCLSFSSFFFFLQREVRRCSPTDAINRVGCWQDLMSLFVAGRPSQKAKNINGRFLKGLTWLPCFQKTRLCFQKEGLIPKTTPLLLIIPFAKTF